jgi:hypothetical protein
VRLRAKLAGVSGAVKSLFTGQAAPEDPAVTKMNALRVRRAGARRVCFCLCVP